MPTGRWAGGIGRPRYARDHERTTGQLVTDRLRELTPRPATPKAVLNIVADVVRQLEATGELIVEAGSPVELAHFDNRVRTAIAAAQARNAEGARSSR